MHRLTIIVAMAQVVSDVQRGHRLRQIKLQNVRQAALFIQPGLGACVPIAADRCVTVCAPRESPARPNQRPCAWAGKSREGRARE